MPAARIAPTAPLHARNPLPRYRVRVPSRETNRLVQVMWQNNIQGGSDFDAGQAVREFRQADIETERAAQARIDAHLVSPWDEVGQMVRLLRETRLGQ